MLGPLTENGYDYYKSKEYWIPLEAAYFVSGFYSRSDWLHESEDYRRMSLVLDASIKAFKNKKLKVFKELKERAGTNYMTFFEAYCPDFCRNDDVYQIYYLSCFEPLEYMRWIVTERIIRIPPIIGITLEGGLRWNIPPNYNEDKPTHSAVKPISKFNPSLARNYEIIECLFTPEYADPVSNGNPIGQNKKSIIETDDGESKVNPEIDQVKKFEQDIKNIKISCGTDSQITFQEPGKKKEFITYDSLGLKNVHLKAFEDVLKNSPHYYKTGPSKDKKTYDKLQKQLKHMNDMLLKNLFKEKLKFPIPNGYKLYELEKTKEPGTYKFKFGIEYKDTEDHDESSKATLIKKLDIAYQKHLDDPDNQNNLKEVVDLSKTGMNRGFLTEEEVKKYFEKDRLEDKFSELEKEDIQPTIDTNEDNR